MSTCPVCNSPTPANVRFCTQCGAPQAGSRTTAAVSSPLSASRTTQAVAARTPARSGVNRTALSLIIAGGATALISSAVSWWYGFAVYYPTWAWRWWEYFGGDVPWDAMLGLGLTLGVVLAVVAAALAVLQLAEVSISGAHGVALAAAALMALAVVSYLRSLLLWGSASDPGLGLPLAIAAVVLLLIGSIQLLVNPGPASAVRVGLGTEQGRAASGYGNGYASSTASKHHGDIPGIAIAGFVMAIVCNTLPPLNIVALVLSWMGYNQAKREQRPSGLALAGIIISILGIVVTVVAAVVFLGLMSWLNALIESQGGY